MTSPAASRFLDLRALAALEHLRFATRQRIEGSYSGRHRSRRLGGAGEFADYREYSEGEDLRRLDWKVLARSGRAYVRLYQDETNLNCLLLLDASGSMAFGQPRTKLEYVQYLATALSHVIGRQQDQVGLAIVNGELAEFVAPGSTPSHVQHVHAAIERLATTPETKLAEALEELWKRSMRRGVLMLMTDFLVDDLEAVFAIIRLFRHRRWEVVTLHVIHPDEEKLPDGAAYRFVGMENDGTADVSPAEIRDLYRERFENHAAMVRSMALASGCDYRRVSTAVPYLQTLGGFLVGRAG
jgi:uncharacterized protein (DUF58 family)